MTKKKKPDPVERPHREILGLYYHERAMAARAEARRRTDSANRMEEMWLEVSELPDFVVEELYSAAMTSRYEIDPLRRFRYYPDDAKKKGR